jgi:hypothetical protein
MSLGTIAEVLAVGYDNPDPLPTGKEAALEPATAVA